MVMCNFRLPVEMQAAFYMGNGYLSGIMLRIVIALALEQEISLLAELAAAAGFFACHTSGEVKHFWQISAGISSFCCA